MLNETQFILLFETKFAFMLFGNPPVAIALIASFTFFANAQFASQLVGD